MWNVTYQWSSLGTQCSGFLLGYGPVGTQHLPCTKVPLSPKVFSVSHIVGIDGLDTVRHSYEGMVRTLPKSKSPDASQGWLGSQTHKWLSWSNRSSFIKTCVHLFTKLNKLTPVKILRKSKLNHKYGPYLFYSLKNPSWIRVPVKQIFLDSFLPSPFIFSRDILFPSTDNVPGTKDGGVNKMAQCLL